MNEITIKYFASIREVLGHSSEKLVTPAHTLADLRAQLVARGGVYAEALASGKAVRIALNQVMAGETALLVAGAEVAFFPPVTGG